MTNIPTLLTYRLTLRPFSLSDASRVQELAGEWEVVQTTLNLPYPYENGMAEQWISTHLQAFEIGQGVTFAIELRIESLLIGAIGLSTNKVHQWAELGYWIGKPYWNQGYCTEAAKEVLRYGFEELKLNRIQARHMAKNAASGRVMEKIGMRLEGTLRQSFRRFGVFEDAVMHSILRKEYSTT
jgi:ribosomal-protein-alanine N-acetyltransferase